MATIEQLEQRVLSLEQKLTASILDDDPYQSPHTGPEIDAAIDRAKAGGDIDISLSKKINPNLLDNWYFQDSVNQRNVSGTIDTVGYFLDRWKLVSGSATVGSNGITLNGTIVQILETAVSTDVTASALTTEGIVNASYDSSSKTFYLNGTGQTFVAAKLELGTQQTLAHQENGNWVLNEIPDYGEQLRRCQRYFYAFNFEDWSGVGTYWGKGTSSTGIELYNLTFPVTMRVNPSVKMLRVYDTVNGSTYDIVTDGYYSKKEGLRAIGITSGMTVTVDRIYTISKAQFSADL